MKRTFIYTLLFFSILALGVFLRTYKLTQIPPSLSHDETAIAYNAYSILTTGKDEYGESYPVLFRSFDDYKLPGMVYSTVPFIALFGKTEMAARLPSALFGILALILIYCIAYELIISPATKNAKDTHDKRTIAALSAMGVLAIQPWHVNFSRQLFESNGAVFWLMLGILMLLKSRRAYATIFYAGVSFVISLYFYYSVRLVIPFILLVYAYHFRKRILKEWKITLLSVIFCAALFAPLGIQMVSPGGLERISIVSVANDRNYLARRDEFVRRMGTNPSVFQKILYNRRVALALTAIENYGKNISFRNLFIAGTGTYGALFPFEAVLILLGLVSISTLDRFAKILIYTWAFTAFLPGAFSTNQPNTLRTLVAAPVFALISGLGVYTLVIRTKKQDSLRVYAIGAIILLCVFLFRSFPAFLHAYFVDNPTNNAIAFADGNKQMVAYAQAHKNEYDRIVISGYYWRPYIFMLYWSDIDPRTYQAHGSRDQIGTYTFTSASWDTSGTKLMNSDVDILSVYSEKRILFLLSPAEYTLHQNMLTKIDTISGNRASDVFIAAIPTK